MDRIGEARSLRSRSANWPVAARSQRSMTVIAALAAAVIFALSSATAEAETPSLRIGLVTCELWLSNPAYARDGENWVYGFWDGLVELRQANSRGVNSCEHRSACPPCRSGRENHSWGAGINGMVLRLEIRRTIRSVDAPSAVSSEMARPMRTLLGR